MSKEKLSKEEKKAAKAEKKAAKKENGGSTDVKSAVIQCVAALLCVAIVAFGANSITDKVNANNLEIAGGAGTGASDGQSAGADDTFTDDFADDTASDDLGGDVADDTASDDLGGDVADDTATAADTGSSSSSASAGSSTGSSAGSKKTSGSSAKKTMSDAEYLKIYNDATKKVADKKLAFSKSRTTKEIKYEAGLALKSFKSIVFKFMGVGDANKFTKSVTSDDADSYFKYFLASSLTAADVTKVVGKDNGSSYTIQIALKDGSSAVTSGKVTQNSKTALDKSGIACGEKDKDYWDHKTAENIYSAISEVPGCGSATIKERYSGAVVTMNVTKDGKITSLSAKFTFHVDIDGVMGSSGVAEAESTVTMNNFKW